MSSSPATTVVTNRHHFKNEEGFFYSKFGKVQKDADKKFHKLTYGSKKFLSLYSNSSLRPL